MSVPPGSRPPRSDATPGVRGLRRSSGPWPGYSPSDRALRLEFSSSRRSRSRRPRRVTRGCASSRPPWTGGGRPPERPMTDRSRLSAGSARSWRRPGVPCQASSEIARQTGPEPRGSTPSRGSAMRSRRESVSKAVLSQPCVGKRSMRKPPADPVAPQASSRLPSQRETDDDSDFRRSPRRRFG